MSQCPRCGHSFADPGLARLEHHVDDAHQGLDALDAELEARLAGVDVPELAKRLKLVEGRVAWVSQVRAMAERVARLEATLAEVVWTRS